MKAPALVMAFAMVIATSPCTFIGVGLIGSGTKEFNLLHIGFGLLLFAISGLLIVAMYKGAVNRERVRMEQEEANRAIIEMNERQRRESEESDD